MAIHLPFWAIAALFGAMGTAGVADGIRERKFRDSHPDLTPEELDSLRYAEERTESLRGQFEHRKGQTRWALGTFYWFRDDLGRARFTCSPQQPNCGGHHRGVYMGKFYAWCEAPPTEFYSAECDVYKPRKKAKQKRVR